MLRLARRADLPFWDGDQQRVARAEPFTVLPQPGHPKARPGHVQAMRYHLAGSEFAQPFPPAQQGSILHALDGLDSGHQPTLTG